MSRILTLSLGLLILPVAAVQAQEMDHSQHGQTSAEATSTEAASASTQAYQTAAAKMHQEMMVPYTGDADVDFIRGMIPHHKGAVDMAQIVLEHGKDPKVRDLAKQIIAAQDAEIAWMEQWLSENAEPAKP